MILLKKSFSFLTVKYLSAYGEDRLLPGGGILLAWPRANSYSFGGEKKSEKAMKLLTQVSYPRL